MSCLGTVYRYDAPCISDKNSYFIGKNGEIVYSKNNVCVHEAAENSQCSVSTADRGSRAGLIGCGFRMRT